MKKIYTLLLVMSCLNLFGQEDDKVKWLEENVFAIKSLTDYDDFSDLAPLKDLLKNKEILFLGEGQHYHGSTLQAKNRLVRFLHQELDFDVLIFESGFYESNLVDREIGSSKDPIYQSTQAFYRWPLDKQSKTVFEYIGQSKQTDKPISLAGFDAKVGTGGPIYVKFKRDFDLLLDSLKLSKNDLNYTLLTNCFKKMWEAEFSDRPKGDTVEVFKWELQSLIDKLEQNKRRNEYFSFWHQNVKSLKNSLDFVWYFKNFSELKLVTHLNELYSLRDKYNAENLIWLLENKFKGRKVIVWAATAHLAYDLEDVRVRGLKSTILNFKDFYSTGHWLKKQYQDKIYSIGFTGYSIQKKKQNGKKLKYLRNGSKRNIEYSFHQLNRQYTFLDLSQKRLPEWLISEMMSGLMGYRKEISIIPNTLDGIFYIDEIERATVK